ncbi:sodium:calcium antiporter [Halobellus litoreus]|uniref:Sodium:calcium antiporter n=1 Tax=Halobellus litoreus TaxID=755310 RepID=A0ABD6DW82_9EURY|nr:sodium:calcium antiporter [Halobellus litoreus]
MVVPDIDPLLLSELAVGAVALYALVTGAQRAIDALLGLARRYDVPEVLIGLTVVAIGTSLPELSAHVTASAGIVSGALDYRTTSAVVLGGNMGSSTTQQFLLFAILLLGFGRIELSNRLLTDTFVPMIVGLVLTLALSWDGTVSRIDGAILLVGFGVYLGFGYLRRQGIPAQGAPSTNVARDSTVAVSMLGLVLLSASILLAVIQDVVAGVLLGGSMVGVLTLGIAASFPELSTVLDGIRRKTPIIAVGTLIGSNIVNPLIGFGLGGVISTYHVPVSVVVWDLPFKIVAAVGLLLYVRYKDGILTRHVGVTLIGLYFVYIVGRMLLFPGQ